MSLIFYTIVVSFSRLIFTLTMLNKKLLILTILLLLNTFTNYSQRKKKFVNIDSLYRVLQTKPDSPHKVDQLIELYKKSIKQKGIRKDVLDEALILAENLRYYKGIAICYNRKGITARYEQDYGQSVMFHKRALTYFKKTKDTFYTAKCYNSLAVTYRKLNLEKEAFENYLIGLKLSEELHNKRGESISLNGMGNVFLNTEQYNKALKYFKRAIAIETDKKSYKNREYGYANIGEVFMAKKEYDSAFYYFDESFKIAKKHPHKENLAIKHILFGKLYQQEKKYKQSSKEYQIAIPELKKYKNTRYLSKALINLGINETQLNDYQNAISHINKGLELGLKIKSKENITLGYDALVKYYTHKKNYKKALKAHIKAKIYHDSIVNVISQKSMISAKIAYETAEKDREIQLLDTEKKESEAKAKRNFKRFLTTAIISLVSIGFLLIFLYLYRKNSDLELQQKNAELQNYILKIDELKIQAKNNKTTDKDISDKFKKYNLSKREIEVLTHISNGLNNDQISEKMFVSKNTIKTHITHIYAKLEVKSRIQAVQKMKDN